MTSSPPPHHQQHYGISLPQMAPPIPSPAPGYSMPEDNRYHGMPARASSYGHGHMQPPPMTMQPHSDSFQSGGPSYSTSHMKPYRGMSSHGHHHHHHNHHQSSSNFAADEIGMATHTASNQFFSNFGASKSVSVPIARRGLPVSTSHGG